MKILVHSNYNPVASRGGIEVVVAEVINVIKSLRFNIVCFFGDDANSVHVVDDVKYISARIIWRFRGAPLLMFGNLKFFYYGIKSDLIVFQEPFPLLWPAIFLLRNIFRKRVLVLIHADPAAQKHVKFFYGIIRAIVFTGATSVSTSPNLHKKVFSKNYKKNEVIPLCIPDIRLNAAQVQLDVPKKYALYIGRLANYKGIEILIKTAQNMPHVNFVIAGDGPLRSVVRDAMSSFDFKNITFINKFISEDEKFYLIEKSYFLIFPSTSVNEAFGLVQLEAMRSGKALINTDLDTGVNYVAPNMVCALTVKSNDVGSLLVAVNKLWESNFLVEKLGHQGRVRYEELFSIDSFKSSWSNIINKCLIINS
jgi:rhamnosyl/mannosyltransferase